MLDLEISNASLLAINASLERGRHKQAGEIRELRRKFRDRSLHLPLASPSAGGAGEFPPGTAALMSPGTEYPPSDTDEAANVVEQDWDTILAEDPPFALIAAKLEDLVRRAQQAYEAEPERAGTKVIPAFAARTGAADDDLSQDVGTDVDADADADASLFAELSTDSPALAFGGRLRRSPAASSLASPDASVSLSASPLPLTPELPDESFESPIAVRVAKVFA